VPPWLWWFVASHGKHTRAALLHDHLIDLPDVPDERADRLFRVALEESDVHFVRRWLMWTAVSLATVKRRHGRLVIGLFALNLLGFLGAATWSVVGPEWLWVVAAGLGLVGFAWGPRRWPLSVLGACIVAVPTLVIGIVYVVNYVVDELVHAVTGGRPPEFGQPYREESGPF
jgi:hypothetical protein